LETSLDLASATIDHLVSITIFLAAILLFINLFSQTNQTALVYEEHRATATKCSDLIDTMLLNPGTPNNWGQSNATPTGFGVQDPEFTEYQLSAFSLMRLAPFGADTVIYNKTSPETLYSQVSQGFGNSLLLSHTDALNYSWAQKLLGINSTYGFQLTLTPVLTVTITENQASSPLRLSLTAMGTGFALSGARVNYVLIRVMLPMAPDQYPSYNETYGVATTDIRGSVNLEFPGVTDGDECYALIAYVHLGGLVGVGYQSRVISTAQYVVPMIGDFADQNVLLAHNFDLNSSGSVGSSLKYSATFVVLTEDYQLRNMTLDSPNTVGTLTSGSENPYISLTIPAYTPGILIVTYENSLGEGGVVVMPWGISSLVYPVTFGGDPRSQEWVSTDIRQVIINHVAYHAKLSLWSYPQNLLVNP
jgi:hypothetical protein